jgi:formate transporter
MKVLFPALLFCSLSGLSFCFHPTHVPRHVSKIRFQLNRLHMSAAGQLDKDKSYPAAAPPTAIESMNSVDQTWEQLEAFGETLSRYTKQSLFFRSLFAGFFVGFGGILASSVGFDMNGLPWLPGNGFQRFLCGAVGFPLSVLLISCTGCGTWTGDMLLVARALFSDSKRTTLKDAMRFGLITWIGGMLGTATMAALATAADLPACGPCVAIAQHKLELTFLQVFLRAIGGGVLIVLAGFLSKLNRDMVGKAIGIWFPVSTYAICDFEHVLAANFFLTCARLNGHPISFKQLLGILVPGTLGNIVGGGLLVGLGLFSIPKRVVEEKEKPVTA